MSSYFKYTNGDALTLNGSDYIGFFNLSGNNPYTEKAFSEESELLTWKNTFKGDVFQEKMHWNNTYSNIENVFAYYSNIFDTLNTQGVEEIVNTVDKNNLICFKGFHLFNPTIYNFENNFNLYYGMSSDTDSILNTSTYKHVEPFSSFSEWEFLDSVKTGSFFLNSAEEFKYFCSTGDKDYVLKGSFNSGNTLEVVYFKDLHPDYTTTPDYTYHIHHDPNRRIVYTVNNDYIRTYDSSNYDNCDNLPLIDQYPLIPTTTHDHILGKSQYAPNNFRFKYSDRFHTHNENNPQYIKFGKNYRTAITNNTLLIVNKYSNLTEYIFELSASEILDIDVSPYTDDVILIYTSDNSVYFQVISSPLFSESTTTILKNIQPSSNMKIRFSSVDSDQFYIYSETQFQSRSISNPEYPVGVMENGELQYYKRYKCNEAREKYNKINIKPNSYSYASNRFNVLTFSETTKTTNMYGILHNIGRIYVLKQPIINYLYSLIPDNLVKYFSDVEYSESSLGLQLNNILLNIVKDTINLFSSAEGKFIIDEQQIDVNTLEEMNIQISDLLLNGNETVNVVALQRILTTISNIQSKLIPS